MHRFGLAGLLCIAPLILAGCATTGAGMRDKVIVITASSGFGKGVAWRRPTAANVTSRRQLPTAPARCIGRPEGTGVEGGMRERMKAERAAAESD